jgi:HD-GYP domain-containing protein (c-di-GMP phosphodiesterase class II)
MEIPLSDFIRTLRRIGDLHSIDTEDHAVRTQNFAQRIGEKLNLDSMQIQLLRYGADAHDFGKIFIDASILDKAGRLNKAQRAQMQKHSELGYEALEFIQLPREIMDVVLCHHEHFDGSGYPRKLRGEEIPLYARIVTIADMWDALNSDRPYRSAWSPLKALEIMTKHASWFDPKLFAIFLSLVRETRGELEN